MSIACMLVTHLPVKLETLRDGGLRGKPVLVAEDAASKKRVLDHSAEAHGVVAGMPLEQALSRCPAAFTVPADVAAYAEAWSRVLDTLEQRSPVVEDAGLGLAYVDLKGLDRLYGGEANLVESVIRAAPSTYRPRAGVAQGKFPAFAAALHASPGGAFRTTGDDDAASFLAPLPVSLLPASWRVKERLQGFGLDSVGSIARLPFDAMQGEFGREGARLWRLANGCDEEPLKTRPHEERLLFEISFPAPTASLPAILVALEGLLAQAFRGPPLRGRFVRVALLSGRHSSAAGQPWSRRIAFREPVGSRDQAVLLLRHALESASMPGPLESLSLTLTGITGEAGRQESLFWDVRRVEQLDDALRQLEARLGCKSPMYRVREVEPWSRIPERRRALVPYRP